jgi:predicted permease
MASRAPMRSREIALRLAIGAGRARVVRQLVTESVLIAAIGGAAGLAVGYAGVLLFRQFQIPTDFPIVPSFDLDRRALTLSLVVSLISAILFGLAPAVRSTRTDLTAAMRATDAAGFGRRRRWGRAILVAGQVAVSVVLLVIATVLYRGFRELLTAGPGYRTDHLLQLSFDPTLLRYSNARAQQFFELVADRTRSVPGVKSAALASSAPTDVGPSTAVAIVPEGVVLPAGTDTASVLTSVVDEHYFDTVGLPIVKGRAFRATDSAAAPIVAIVNEHVAQLYWPGADPLRKRFQIDGRNGPWVEIVGVAKTAKYMVLSEPPRSLIYLMFRQRPQQRMTLIAESAGDPASLAAPLRDVIRSLDPNQPIYNVRTIQESYEMRMVTIINILVELVGGMGTMGLALAFVGLYGLVAYAASRRTREIGIRMAVGANRGAVLRMIARQGAMLAVSGLALGLVASVGARRAMAAIFPGGAARGFDAPAFALVALAVLTVTLLAAFVPARRASRINPTEALRHE